MDLRLDTIRPIETRLALYLLTNTEAKDLENRSNPSLQNPCGFMDSPGPTACTSAYVRSSRAHLTVDM